MIIGDQKGSFLFLQALTRYRKTVKYGMAAQHPVVSITNGEGVYVSTHAVDLLYL